MFSRNWQRDESPSESSVDSRWLHSVPPTHSTASSSFFIRRFLDDRNEMEAAMLPRRMELVASPESRKLKYLATMSEDMEVDPTHDSGHYHHPLVMALNTNEFVLALTHRSRSDTFVCTLQGIVFEDVKRQYQSKLTKLVALAANVNTLGTQSNVLLAKKTLRYRKGRESRRNVV